MNSREFEIYSCGEFNSDNINAGMIIVKKMLDDIDVILKDYDIGEEKRIYLTEKKHIISEFLNKYEKMFSAERIRQEYMNLMLQNNLNDNDEKRFEVLQKVGLKNTSGFSQKYSVLIPYYEQIFSDDENGEANALEFYQQFYKELSNCFDIEDEIYTDIVIPIWKDYLDFTEGDFVQGDEFAYLLHSSNRFINLPGSKHYQSKKLSEADTEHKIGFISTSLITDKEMETENTNVGVLLKIKGKTILTASSSDCGTLENNQRNVTNVKVNEDGMCVSIGLPHFESQLSKLSTPKKIERDAMKASINNTGEILNAGKWICPIYTEVVVDKEDFELDGIFFKTTGCDINLQDYIVAKQMEMYYNKKLRIVNQSVYREKNGLTPYTKEELERFNEQLQFYFNEENYGMFKENPVLYRNLIQSYYKEVVCEANFKEDTKTKVEVVFTKIINHLNKVIQEKGLIDSNEVKLDEIMEINLDEKKFPTTRYIPEIEWGICEVTKEEIGKEFALSIPIDLKKKVEKLLITDIKLEKAKEEK